MSDQLANLDALSAALRRVRDDCVRCEDVLRATDAGNAAARIEDLKRVLLSHLDAMKVVLPVVEASIRHAAGGQDRANRLLREYVAKHEG